MKRLALPLLLLCLTACTPPPPPIPSLTPMGAQELLNTNAKAKTWIEYVRKQDASCEYSVDLPDQSSHPSSIDVEHVVKCGGKLSPKAFDAMVSYEYDKTAGQWTISQFRS